jgi:tripartite-type tricarboxylate transporter receptor subunit TctC
MRGSMAVVALMLLAGLAQGQAFPTKPVMIMVPAGPGGAADAETRLYAAKLTEYFGGSQKFVIEYKPGAAGTLANSIVARAAPDGHTLLTASIAFVSTAAIGRDLPYDPLKDFAPITLLSKRTPLLFTHPKAPFKNMKEYIAYAKANPGKTTFGTTGVGGAHHFAGLQIHAMAGTEATFIHYRNTPARMTDITAGRVDATIASFISAAPSIRAGKLVLLGVLSMEPSPIAPDWPTLAKQGFAYEQPSWLGMLTTARTPRPIINTLNAVLAKIVKAPEVSQKFANESIITVGSTPEEFGQYLSSEVTRMRTTAEKFGITTIEE